MTKAINIIKDNKGLIRDMEYKTLQDKVGANMSNLPGDLPTFVDLMIEFISI